MFRKEMRQKCTKCKGTGVNRDKVLTDNSGRTLLAPTYRKGEGDRPQHPNCSECGGSGYTMQPSPTTIMLDGKKVQLSPEEAQGRYDVPFV